MLLCERFLIIQHLLQILPCVHDIFIGGYGGGGDGGGGDGGYFGGGYYYYYLNVNRY